MGQHGFRSRCGQVAQIDVNCFGLTVKLASPEEGIALVLTSQRHFVSEAQTRDFDSGLMGLLTSQGGIKRMHGCLKLTQSCQDLPLTQEKFSPEWILIPMLPEAEFAACGHC